MEVKNMFEPFQLAFFGGFKLCFQSNCVRLGNAWGSVGGRATGWRKKHMLAL
jgi:hypothetical protein